MVTYKGESVPIMNVDEKRNLIKKWNSHEVFVRGWKDDGIWSRGTIETVNDDIYHLIAKDGSVTEFKYNDLNGLIRIVNDSE